MAERDRGLRAWLSLSWVYRAFQDGLGAEAERRFLVAHHVLPQPGERVLDIGCGTADILAHMPEVEYVGFDTNAAYVRAAQRRFGDRGTFCCRDVRDADTASETRFDLVLAVGVLHHLDDEAAAGLFALARRVLAEGGRVVTADPCFVPRQSRVARWVILMDRGRHVRDEVGYRMLAEKHFHTVRTFVHHGLLRIPYTHVVQECRP